MTVYVLRRFGQTLGFILLVWLLVYTLLVMIMPHGLLSEAEGTSFFYATSLPPEYTRAEYKLDKPWPLNFFVWLFDPSDTTQQNRDFQTIPKGIDVSIGNFHLQGSGVLTGEFGLSQVIAHSMSVGSLISTRFNRTFILVLLSIFTATLLSIPVGVLAALRAHTPVGHGITLISIAGFSIPSYILGILLIVLLAVIPYELHTQKGWEWLPYLPTGGTSDTGQDTSAINHVYHLVLPVITLALPQIALLSRHVRFSLLEILQLHDIRTAWAKGLSVRRVLMKHALRNALIPLITSVGLMVPVLIAGSILVESVFAFNGLGQLLFRAVGGCLAGPETYAQLCSDRGIYLKPMDYPVTLALMMLMVAVVALSNMVVDILYVVADPRIDPKQKARA